MAVVRAATGARQHIARHAQAEAIEGARVQRLDEKLMRGARGGGLGHGGSALALVNLMRLLIAAAG